MSGCNKNKSIGPILFLCYEEVWYHQIENKADVLPPVDLYWFFEIPIRTEQKFQLVYTEKKFQLVYTEKNFSDH